MANVKVGANASDFKKEMKSMLGEMKLINSELSLCNERTKDYSDSSKALEEKLEKLTKKEDIQNRMLKTQREEITKLNKDMQKEITEEKRVAEAIAKKQKELEKSTKETGKNSDASKKLGKELKDLQKDYKVASNNIENTNKKLETATIKANKTEKELIGLRREIKAVSTQAQNMKINNLVNGLNKVGTSFTNVGSAITTGVLVPFSALVLATGNMASDLEESMNKVTVCFGDSTKSVVDFAETSLKSYGISKQAALDMTATWGDMATSMGLTQEEASKMAIKIAGLTGDISSFKNVRTDISKTALTGIFTGETESLKQLGYVMTQANLEAYALEKGMLKAPKTSAKYEEASINLKIAQENLLKVTEKYGAKSLQTEKAMMRVTNAETKLVKASNKGLRDLSQKEQVQLRYNYILEKSKNAHGDFARTSQGMANSSRTLGETIKELGTNIGTVVLPPLTDLTNKAVVTTGEFVKWADENKRIVEELLKLGKVVGVSGLVSLGIGKLSTLMGKVTLGFTNFKGKVANVDNALRKFNPAISSSFSLLNPWTVAIMAGGVALGYLATRESEAEYQARKQYEAIKAQSDAYRELEQTTRETAESRLGEIEQAKNLKRELDGLVDKNGKIKKGYEDRVSFITQQLAEATGAEINIVDGVIQKYGDLEQKITDVIEKQRIQAILEGQKTLYQEAVKNIDNAYKQFEKIKSEYENAEKANMASIDALRMKYGANWLEDLKYNSAITNDIEYQNYLKSKGIMDQKRASYNTLKGDIKKYNENINLYERNSVLAASKNKEDWKKIKNEYTATYKDGSHERIKQLEEEIRIEKLKLNDYKKLNKETDDNVTRNRVKGSETRIKQLEKELNSNKSTLDKGKKELGDKSKEIGKEITNGLNNKSGAEKAGKDIVNGVKNGIETEETNLFTTMGKLASNLLKNFKDKLGIKSPSREFAKLAKYIPDGIEMGINDNTKVATGAINTMASGMVNTFNPSLNATVNTKTLKDTNNNLNLANIRANGQETYVIVENKVYMDSKEISNFTVDKTIRKINYLDSRNKLAKGMR